MWKKHWVWSLAVAFASSSAMLALLSYWDENGFDFKKDAPKLVIVVLTVLAQWVRTGGTDKIDPQ